MEILERLTGAYGVKKWSPRLNALDELIFTVLTQHTSDINAGVAYKSLRRRFPTWGQVLDAGTETVAEAIRPGGLADQKAPRIQAMLGQILRQRGELDLEFLQENPLQEAKSWLVDLPGVGPKTAAVVLAFSLGMPAMPVDTHVFRVSRRLGLISLKTSVDDAHTIMEAQVPPNRVYEYHVLLITHGRQTCKAQRPACEACALEDLCPYRPAFQNAFDKAKYRRPVRAGRPL
jgi:endonuclease-3